MDKEKNKRLKRLGFTDSQIESFTKDELSEEEIVRLEKKIYKKNFVKILICLGLLFLPVMLFMLYNSIVENNSDGFLLLGALLFVVTFMGVGCDVFISTNMPKNRFRERRAALAKTTHEGVEGIVEGKEFDMIDKDFDGRIMIHEFYPLTEKEVVDKILKIDENFSKTEFVSYVKDIFLSIEQAFLTKDVSKLRAFETDALFAQHKSYIKGLHDEEKRGKKNIKIKGVLLKDFKIEGNKQILTVALTVANNKTVYNNTTACKGDIPYILLFARNKDVKTKKKTTLSTRNCYNCGAVIDVDGNGICKYCGSALISGEFDWVLIDIKDISINGNNINTSVFDIYKNGF